MKPSNVIWNVFQLLFNQSFKPFSNETHTWGWTFQNELKITIYDQLWPILRFEPIFWFQTQRGPKLWFYLHLWTNWILLPASPFQKQLEDFSDPFWKRQSSTQFHCSLWSFESQNRGIGYYTKAWTDLLLVQFIIGGDRIVVVLATHQEMMAATAIFMSISVQ